MIVCSDPPYLAALEHFYREELHLQGPIPLHDPWLNGNEWVYLKEALDTNWVSSVGPFVARFEHACAELTGTAAAVAIVNGTCALHVSLRALGVRDGDLVVCPAISFVGTANAIAHCGAEPIFIDVERSHLTLSPDQLKVFLRDECHEVGSSVWHRRTGRRIMAIVVVHIFGHPADMDAINEVAADYNLAVIEDAAESVGSLYKGRPCGSLARVGILSFNGNKTVTSGGGGAVVTDDRVLAQRIKHLSTTAKTSNGFELEHDEVGYNYRLPSLNAALGCAQLEQLAFFVKTKRIIADRYSTIFGPRLIREPAHSTSNYWLNAVILDVKSDRDTLLKETNARDIQARPCWRALPSLPMYSTAPRAQAGVATALDLSARVVNLPSSPKLTARIAARNP